jgi:hypothetical protein
MDYINANATPNVKLKVIANLYYPGYNADNVQSKCKDAATGATVNMRTTFLPAIAKMNYWMCEYARQKGFKCADNFAQYMGADYDSNGDGQVDSDALRYVAGESEASYVTRITSTLRPTCATPTRTSCRRPAATTTSSPTTCTRPTPAAPSRPACGAAAPAPAHRATPASPAARARSGTATATSAWAGRCRPTTRRLPDRLIAGSRPMIGSGPDDTTPSTTDGDGVRIIREHGAGPAAGVLVFAGAGDHRCPGLLRVVVAVVAAAPAQRCRRRPPLLKSRPRQWPKRAPNCPLLPRPQQLRDAAAHPAHLARPTPAAAI